MTSEKTSTFFKHFQAFMEDETGLGKLITYGIASTGLCVALYKIRPFTKFKKPSDVPSHFLQSRVPLRGTVMHVEPSNGVLLMVNHQPLLFHLQFRNQTCLPIRIAGVNIMGNGVSWLQTVVNGNLITFVPIVKEKDYLECIIAMPQEDQDSLKINEELLKLGLGTIREPWTKLKNKHILTYRKSLVNAQKWAIFRRNGHWHFVKQPTLLWKVQIFIIDKIKLLLPTNIAKLLNL